MMLALVMGIGLLCFAPGQYTIAPMDRDEARFAQSSKQMLDSGDWVTPRFQEELRAKKPVGIYWMQSATAAIFGADQISSYRVPSLIGALIAIIATTVLATFFLTPVQACFAGLFMATSLVMVVESHLAKTDAMLSALIIIQQIFLWKIIQITHDGKYVSGKYAVLFWSVMALAILVKGPIAPLIALLTLGVMMAVERRVDYLTGLRPIIGLVILTSLVLPWVLMVTSATDGAFLSIAVKGDLVSKLQSGQESHGAPPLTYLMIIILTFWPGSLFFARALPIIISQWRQRFILFCLGWVMPFWIILELTPTKLPHYNLPVFAALAVFASLGISGSLPKAKAKLDKPPSPETPVARAKRILKNLSLGRILIFGWEYLFMLAGPLLGVFILYVTTDANGSRHYAFIVLLASVLVSAAGFWWHRGGGVKAVTGIIAGAALFYIGLMGGVLPSLEKIRVSPRLHAEIASLTPPPEVVIAAGYHEPSLVFIQGTDTLLFTPKDSALALAEAENGLALIEKRSEQKFLETAAFIGLKVKSIRHVTGYNISRGQDVTISFYKRLDDTNN